MRHLILPGLMAVALPAFAADVGQDSIDACIDELRATGLPDAQSGTVESTEFSEANSLVILRDRGESTWRCLVSNDGVVAELSVLNAADDGEGAMAGAPSVGSSSDLSAFVGARAGQAEMGIQNLGYELIRSEGLTSFWFNRETGACARITTADGRYSDVTMVPAGDC